MFFNGKKLKRKTVFHKDMLKHQNKPLKCLTMIIDGCICRFKLFWALFELGKIESILSHGAPVPPTLYATEKYQTVHRADMEVAKST